MGLFSKLSGSKRAVRVSAEALGVFDATGGEAGELIAADTAALAPFFGEIRTGTEAPPRCTALLVYCRFGKRGEIVGSALDLGEVVAASGAPVVIVATPHKGARYESVRRYSSWTPSNLVLTIDRRGGEFPDFFARLFALMAAGTPMPEAWVKLAPQGGPARDEGPATIFHCQLGQIAFEAVS